MKKIVMKIRFKINRILLMIQNNKWKIYRVKSMIQNKKIKIKETFYHHIKNYKIHIK